MPLEPQDLLGEPGTPLTVQPLAPDESFVADFVLAGAAVVREGHAASTWRRSPNAPASACSMPSPPREFSAGTARITSAPDACRSATSRWPGRGPMRRCSWSASIPTSARRPCCAERVSKRARRGGERAAGRAAGGRAARAAELGLAADSPAAARALPGALGHRAAALQARRGAAEPGAGGFGCGGRAGCGRDRLRRARDGRAGGSGGRCRRPGWAASPFPRPRAPGAAVARAFLIASRRRHGARRGGRELGPDAASARSSAPARRGCRSSSRSGDARVHRGRRGSPDRRPPLPWPRRASPSSRCRSTTRRPTLSTPLDRTPAGSAPSRLGHCLTAS